LRFNRLSPGNYVLEAALLPCEPDLDCPDPDLPAIGENPAACSAEVNVSSGVVRVHVVYPGGGAPCEVQIKSWWW
jgi:hypothetical protein